MSTKKVVSLRDQQVALFYLIFVVGTSRMPQWQVDDISDLNADIEGSLNLSPDLANNSYNVVGYVSYYRTEKLKRLFI